MKREDGYLRRFNYLLAWFTAVLFAILAISGFGITNPGFTSRLTGGIMTRVFSIYLHANLAAPVLILVLIHVLIGMKNALTRFGIIESKTLDATLMILGIFLGTLIVLARYLMLPEG